MPYPLQRFQVGLFIVFMKSILIPVFSRALLLLFFRADLLSNRETEGILLEMSSMSMSDLPSVLRHGPAGGRGQAGESSGRELQHHRLVRGYPGVTRSMAHQKGDGGVGGLVDPLLPQGGWGKDIGSAAGVGPCGVSRDAVET